jgi:hypothetical protein
MSGGSWPAEFVPNVRGCCVWKSTRARARHKDCGKSRGSTSSEIDQVFLRIRSYSSIAYLNLLSVCFHRNMEALLQARHIQDEHNAKSLEPHWGYFSRVLPCAVDKGSCEYLDAVYWMHDVSMLYTFIFWAVVGGILVIWLTLRLVSRRQRTTTSRGDAESARSQEKQGFARRLFSSCGTLRRQWLLPEFGLPSVFGHVSRLQVTILAVLLAYLLVFSYDMIAIFVSAIY